MEAAAYAPLPHRLAEGGMDVCLVRMPFNLAIFGVDRADKVMAEHDYGRWYLAAIPAEAQWERTVELILGE